MASSSADLIRADRSLQLQGQVTLNTVNRLFETFKRQWETGVDTLDCRNVNEADSSAVSFLLACRQFAIHHDQNLYVKGMGDQLTSLARLYGVDTLLNASHNP